MKSNAIQYLTAILKERYGFRWVFIAKRWKLGNKQKINVKVRNGVVINIVDNRDKYENKRRGYLGWNL